MDPERPGFPGPSSLGPRGTQLSTLGIVALGIALLLSLGLNALLAGRTIRMEDEVAALRARVEQQAETIEGLRGGLEGGGSVLDAVAAAVERLRDLTFRSEVDARVLTLEQLRARVEREYREENTRADLEGSQRALEMLGVIPTGLDLYEMLLEMQLEQVAGFYDHEAKEMVVGSGDAEDPTPAERMFLAHEYVHALTDQRFGLGALDVLVERRKDDEAAAFRALIEGDATSLMYRYARDVLTPEEQQELIDSQETIETSKFDLLPVFLQEAFEFPYVDGLAFVEALIGRGGLAAVDRAYDDPPRSTEQILHPERYTIDRDDPQDVDLPDLRDTLGSTWRRLDQGGAGELDLRLIGDLQVAGGGLSARDARVAADGWDGGAYAAYGRGASTVVVVATVWDDEDELDEALDLYSTWLPTRFGNRGENVDVGADGRGWTSGDGAGIVQVIGDRLVILLGPDRSTVMRARDAF